MLQLQVTPLDLGRGRDILGEDAKTSIEHAPSRLHHYKATGTFHVRLVSRIVGFSAGARYAKAWNREAQGFGDFDSAVIRRSNSAAKRDVEASRVPDGLGQSA